MNLPNAITVARIALVPVFLFFAFGASSGAKVAAFVVFLVASLSDTLDGHLARKNDEVTRLGQFLDPTADKLLVGAALIALVVERAFPLWAALVLGTREVWVQVLRTRIVSRGGTLPSSPRGKAKTVTQITLVSWWLLPWDAPNLGHWALLAAALVLSLSSAIDYVLRRRAVEEAT